MTPPRDPDQASRRGPRPAQRSTSARPQPTRRPAAPGARPATGSRAAFGAAAGRGRRGAARREPRLVSGRRRTRALFLGVLFVFTIFAGQLVRLQALDASSVAQQGEALRTATIVVPASRGRILDGAGVALASDAERRTVVVDQKAVAEYTKVVDGTRQKVGAAGAAADIAPLLGAKVTTLRPQLSGISRYRIIAKNVEPLTWRKIAALDIPGVSSEQTSLREYPAGAALAPIIGWSPTVTTGKGADGEPTTTSTGGGGLELLFNSTLQGTPGKTINEYSEDGRQIPMGDSSSVPAVPGRDVTLNVRQDLNWFAYNAIAQQVQDVEADSGSVVVMDRTGKLLAVTQYPSFDPKKLGAKGSVLRSLAFQDAFEPGSTAKVMSIGATLDQGRVGPTDLVTVPNTLKRSDRTFHDSHTHGTERLTVAGVLAQSSNIGTIEVAEKLTASELEKYYRAFGAGAASGVGFPGETAGVFAPSSQWSGSQYYTVMFGQGLSMSAIQAAGVYQTIANDGVRVAPQLIAGTTDEQGTYQATPAPAGQQVLKPETAKTLQRMLESVVGEGGTAANVAIPGYRVAGKTGTAQRYDKAGGYVASFIGMAPADDPQVIVAAIVNGPRKGHFGAAVAGPVFRQVMIQALKDLQIPPTGTAANPYPLNADELTNPRKGSATPSGSASGAAAGR